MKKVLLFLTVMVLGLSLAACGGEKDPGPVITYEGIDTQIEGRIDIMLWSGSGTYLEDIGRVAPDAELFPYGLTAQNDAAAQAVAMKFNEIYPNVQINVLAHKGDAWTDGKIWSQELNTYKDAYGQHPTIWATIDLPGDIANGIVADLSMFSDDPLYQSMNPSIMQMMNYNGFQGGLPQYILPWGIFVNKELAYAKNIDVPDFDWTIDEYTDFQANHETDVYYGSMDTPLRIIETGTNDIAKSLFEYDGTGDFVNLNSDEVRDLVGYLDEWNEHAVWGGDYSEDFMNDNGWWSYNFFKNGKLLTLEGDPWMMGDCATPDEEWWGHCVSSDWDIYPRPSTDYVDNTIGIVLDPMAVYNHCLDDGNKACSDAELTKIQLSYTFAAFWIAETASWEARAEAEFAQIDQATGDVTYSSALNDSFPVVTGDAFNEQMAVWYSVPKHQRFGATDTNGNYVMPGFQEVIRLYEEGQFWDISDKAFPYFYDDDGVRKPTMEEWKLYYDPNINSGVSKGESNFLDTLRGNLLSWNELSNERFQQAWDAMLDGMDRYYPHLKETEEEEATE